jgi:hypothetical protein
MRQSVGKRALIRRAKRPVAVGLVVVGLAAAAACGTSGGGSSASLTASSSALSPSPVSPSATASVAGPSAADKLEAAAVISRLIRFVDQNRYTDAQHLFMPGTMVWSLADMKRIVSIRLRSIKVQQVLPDGSIEFATPLVRTPAPIAGGPDWPNFITVARDTQSGVWRVAALATGP